MGRQSRPLVWSYQSLVDRSIARCAVAPCAAHRLNRITRRVRDGRGQGRVFELVQCVVELFLVGYKEAGLILADEVLVRLNSRADDRQACCHRLEEDLGATLGMLAERNHASRDRKPVGYQHLWCHWAVEVNPRRDLDLFLERSE